MDQLPPELVCKIFDYRRIDIYHFNFARSSHYLWECVKGHVKKIIDNDLKHLRRIQKVASQVGLLTTIAPVSVYFNKMATRCAVCHQHPFDAPQDPYSGLFLCQSCHLAFFPKIEVAVLKRDFDIHPWAMAKIEELEIEELEKSSTRWVSAPSSSCWPKVNLSVLPWEPLAPLVAQGYLCHGKVQSISNEDGWEEIEIPKDADSKGFTDLHDTLWMFSGQDFSRSNLYDHLCRISRKGRFNLETRGLNITYLEREIWLLRCFHSIYNPRLWVGNARDAIGHRELSVTARQWATPESWPLRPWRLSIFPVPTVCCMMTDYLKTPEKAKKDREEFQRYQGFATKIDAMFRAFPDILADRVTWENCLSAENWMEASRIAGEAALTWEERRDRSHWSIELQGCSKSIGGRCLDTELVQVAQKILDFKSKDRDAVIFRFTKDDAGSYRLFGTSWYEKCPSVWDGLSWSRPKKRVSSCYLP
jgi:hypothetical protein